MAESSVQQLSSELSAHQSQSQETHQLLQTLYSGMMHCCCPTATPDLVPVPGFHARTHEPSLPDQATVEQLLAHLQQVFISHQSQSQKLTSVSQQLEAHSADQARAIVALQAAMQLQDCPVDADCEVRRAPAELQQLAETVAAALVSQVGRVTQTQSQIVHLHEQLSQAQAQTDTAKSELTACKEELGGVSHTAHSAQASLQQVTMEICISSVAHNQQCSSVVTSLSTIELLLKQNIQHVKVSVLCVTLNTSCGHTKCYRHVQQVFVVR